MSTGYDPKYTLNRRWAESADELTHWFNRHLPAAQPVPDTETDAPVNSGIKRLFVEDEVLQEIKKDDWNFTTQGCGGDICFAEGKAGEKRGKVGGELWGMAPYVPRGSS